MSTPRQLSFFNLATRYQALSQHRDPLDALTVHVPWETFARPLKRSYVARNGRKAAAPL